jgi:uncharacterized integral membrane protein
MAMTPANLTSFADWLVWTDGLMGNNMFGNLIVFSILIIAYFSMRNQGDLNAMLIAGFITFLPAMLLSFLGIVSGGLVAMVGVFTAVMLIVKAFF